MHGLSQGLRAGILAQRPAPIQMTYLGYIGTTMMPYIDYVITDKYCFQDYMRPYYSEDPLYLDCCCVPTDRKRQIEAPQTRESVGLPTDKFIFSSFNNSYKLNPDMFACWMKILKRVENSVLWIVDDNPWATENLRNFALSHGVDPARLVFTPRVQPPLYIARMPLADIFLDNFPYNAGSTASDIMWMGTPMITLSGKTFVSRMAGSMLHHSGLDELIATNFDDYENLAVALSSNPLKLAEIKAKMLAQREPNGAFDMGNFTRNLEQKYLEIVAAK
jgi:predicted O-linked N-acetylglucosamine transferase (SPINDLY family)